MFRFCGKSRGIKLVGFFKVHCHLPERYYSEPNGAAILLGRVVPPKSSSGRHGGRPSQEQKANPSLIDDEAFFSTSSMTSLVLCELCETLMLS